MNLNADIDPRLAAKLESLRATLSRDPQAAAIKRASFLAEAEQIARNVPIPPVERHNGWMAVFTNLSTAWRKEKKPMFNFVMAMVLVLGLIFGGGGATIAAAQSSMPDDVLYPVKTWSEETRLQMAGGEENRFQIMLELVNRRMEETREMLQEGKAVPEPVLTRLENQLRLAIQLAAGLPDEKAVPALLQLHKQLRTQEQTMAQLQLQEGDSTGEMTRERVRVMLELRLQQAEEGAGNLLQLRKQIRQQNNDCVEPECQQNQHQNQQQNGEQANPTDGIEPSGENPWATGTPTPGSGYGPGESQNPWATGTPTPLSGYGPGPGPDATCTPQPGNGPGPQPTGTVDPSKTPAQCGSCTPPKTPDPIGTGTPQGTPNPGGNNGTPEATPNPGGKGGNP